MMANAITGLRILMSVVLLFSPVFPPFFYALYLIAGLSDMADGMAVIALIKIISIISGYAMQKRYVAVHTTMNKVTGVLLFIFPLTLTIAYRHVPTNVQ